MNKEIIDKKLEKLNGDITIQNYFAQANARYILLNTDEQKSNFPAYTIDDDNLNLLALQYLNLGCCYAEKNLFSDAAVPLEKGASLLEVVHASHANRSSTSNYYGLIAALSYYVAFEYSKAFILISKFETTTIIASLMKQFLQRNYTELNLQLYPILVGREYSDEVLAIESDEGGNQKIYEITIARALDGFIKFYLSGNQEILENAKMLLRNLKEIASLEEDAGTWWVIRLLLLISEGFNEASVWNVLPKYFSLDEEKVKGYIRSLVFMRPRGHFELFITQREALRQVLSPDSGCVVSIPTSSGKTRIAEIAILNTILENPKGKILYIAPFRSLAFEVENSLEKVFEHSGIRVSHLYGGSLYSKLDEMSVDEAHVIVVTPEKAKAIVRANTDVLRKIKLVILDEGHLLGEEKRLIMNEIFYEEVRYYMQNGGGRFLLLSAVLPNAEELARWLTDGTDTTFRNNWRPSEERLGILEWRNNTVNLNWESQDRERSSFNPRFIVAEEVKRYRYKGEERIKYFPTDKNEAVAATAYRLRTFGPVLIFVGIKLSVFVMARAYMKVLGADAKNHSWKKQFNWRAYELACMETYGPDNEWLAFARKGILCHNSDLHSDVRLPLERLMREDKPLAIISTSTLGQGVNLGVSTVIFSTVSQAGTPVKARDFWNIAGRAGRAFIDHEGKILVAADFTSKNLKQRNWHTNYIRETYFDKRKIDRAKSGILSLVVALKEFAQEHGIDFELLLELISENKVAEIGKDALVIDDTLDWIDDTLLSLLLLNNSAADIEMDWIEDFFGKSLAYIQAASNKEISQDQFLAFIKARTSAIIKKVGSDERKWDSIVKSGIPLNSDLILEDQLDNLVDSVDRYLIIGDTSINCKTNLLKDIENIIKGLPVLNHESSYLDYPYIDLIRKKWLLGIPISTIQKIEKGLHVITDIYSFSLPWVLNGIAKKMRNRDCVDQAEIVEELSVLVETGLPSIKKVKVYQSGIRSRSAANEIGDLLDDSFAERPLIAIKRELTRNVSLYLDQVTDITKEWLEMLQRYSARSVTKIATVEPFEFGKVHKKTTTLMAMLVNGEQYLISPDLKFVYKGWGELDFNHVANLPGIEFNYNESTDQWEISNTNPYLEIV